MPLEVLGPLVVVGIGAIVLLVHLLGWSKARKLDAAGAVAALASDFPDAEAGRVVLGDDGASALVETGAGLGVVRAVGVGTLTRVLGPGAAEARELTDGVAVAMADFGAPEVRVRLADAERRADALALARRALGETT